MTKILIVDDEPDIRTSMQSFLEVEGYEIRTAENGINALDILKEDKFDLVLLDILMPDMSGTEVLQNIRNDPELKKQKVAFLSVVKLSEAGEQIVEKLWPMDYFQKPITDFDSFKARLTTILGAKAQTKPTVKKAKPGKKKEKHQKKSAKPKKKARKK